MKLVLSIFLATTIVVPSIISLIDDTENMGLVLEQNEDDNQKENKEGEKETSDKNTFYFVWSDSLSARSLERTANINYYLEGYSNPIMKILLPPPEFEF